MEEIQKTFRQGSKIKKSKLTYIGSILLIVSAFLPSLDVLSKWLIPGMEEARDSRGVLLTVNIWLATLYIAPVVIIVANYFKPNPWLNFFPLLMFFYAGAVYFSPVIGYEVNYLAQNSWLFFIISFFGALCFMYLLKYVRRVTLLEEEENLLNDEIADEFSRLNSEINDLKNKLNQETK